MHIERIYQLNPYGLVMFFNFNILKTCLYLKIHRIRVLPEVVVFVGSFSTISRLSALMYFFSMAGVVWPAIFIMS